MRCITRISQRDRHHRKGRLLTGALLASVETVSTMPTALPPSIHSLPPFSSALVRLAAKRAVHANQQWSLFGPFISQIAKQEAGSLGADIDEALTLCKVPVSVERHLVSSVDVSLSVLSTGLSMAATAGQHVLNAFAPPEPASDAAGKKRTDSAQMLDRDPVGSEAFDPEAVGPGGSI